MGGTWTFRDGLELAWARKGTIFNGRSSPQTVGVLLRTLEERMGIIGRVVMRIIGVVWTLACYFRRSRAGLRGPLADPSREALSKLFRDTWGEKVMGGFSLSLVSLVLMLPGIGLWFAAMVLGGMKGFVIGVVLIDSLFPHGLGFHVRGAGRLQRRALSLCLFSSRCPRPLITDLVAAAWPEDLRSLGVNFQPCRALRLFGVPYKNF